MSKEDNIDKSKKTEKSLLEKKKEKLSQQTLKEWHDDPSNWKLGVFYYNKKDRRLFPPKRIKWTGWTVNFANPVSISAIIGLLILIFAIFRMFHRGGY